MLDVTTNQTTSITCGGGAGAGGGGFANGGLLDDDMMDPLFDEDWLHEHNLDILFDLFEEEIESKTADATNGSSTIFGTSPVTSYLFGTSPSLVSALDLYDLLYFDNQPQQQQQQQQQQTQSQQTSPSIAKAATTTNSTALNNQGKRLDTTYNISRTTAAAANSNHASMQQRNGAMRIKRGFKRGQSEGVSLLARPNRAGGVGINCSKQQQHHRHLNHQQQQHHRHLHHHHHHVHHITGHAVIREHAYAVRSH